MQLVFSYMLLPLLNFRLSPRIGQRVAIGLRCESLSRLMIILDEYYDLETLFGITLNDSLLDSVEAREKRAIIMVNVISELARFIIIYCERAAI